MLRDGGWVFSCQGSHTGLGGITNAGKVVATLQRKHHLHNSLSEHHTLSKHHITSVFHTRNHEKNPVSWRITSSYLALTQNIDLMKGCQSTAPSLARRNWPCPGRGSWVAWSCEQNSLPRLCSLPRVRDGHQQHQSQRSPAQRQGQSPVGEDEVRYNMAVNFYCVILIIWQMYPMNACTTEMLLITDNLSIIIFIFKYFSRPNWSNALLKT